MDMSSYRVCQYLHHTLRQEWMGMIIRGGPGGRSAVLDGESGFYDCLTDVNRPLGASWRLLTVLFYCFYGPGSPSSRLDSPGSVTGHLSVIFKLFFNY